MTRAVRRGAAFVVALTTLSCADPGERAWDLGAPVQTLTTWSHYLGDPARTHYSLLSQIDTTNVSSLEVAWSYASGGLANTIH
jgi:quinoprotein glucose dehydrogenase